MNDLWTVFLAAWCEELRYVFEAAATPFPKTGPLCTAENVLIQRRLFVDGVVCLLSEA
jgi:hypothetical protein